MKRNTDNPGICAECGQSVPVRSDSGRCGPCTFPEGGQTSGRFHAGRHPDTGQKEVHLTVNDPEKERDWDRFAGRYHSSQADGDFHSRLAEVIEQIYLDVNAKVPQDDVADYMGVDGRTLRKQLDEAQIDWKSFKREQQRRLNKKHRIRFRS